ncbi:hypothetical protein [Halobacterium wangiae]|uniref:hypothetical protein n=1 Tax=Halobacterium wangiae TaxID=2902623 RepID=UPI001E58CF05|nr:hypothetical protein [Halobacterium wangiae]
MRRRRFLAAAVGLSTGALAGCTSAGNSATPSTDQTTTEPSTTIDESTTRTTTTPNPVVGDVWVGRSFTYLYAGAHVNAYTVTGSGPQFVFALVADGERPALSLAGETHRPADELPGSTGANAVFYRRDTEDRRVLSYSLPGPVDAPSGAVGDVELDESQLAFLADPAEFAVTDVSVSDTVQTGSEATVSVTVENSGGASGTFRAAATSESISAFGVGSVAVAPGEREAVDISVPVYGEDEERVTVDWGSSSEEQTVAVES